MKIKTYRFAAAVAVLLALCLVFTAPVSAEVVLPAGVTTESFGDKTVTDGTNYYTTLKDALAGIHLTEKRTLWCKPGADVGVMTHGHVCDNLTVYGNGACLTASGEQDFEVDTYKFCHISANPCSGLTKDLTLTVYNLNGCGAWGQRTTGNTVTLNFYGCEDMNRVYISGTSGVNNIALTDCTFLGSVDNRCTLYSNANGEINLTNVQFSNIYAPVNLNHKVAGTQEITISNCTFTNCSTAEYDYAAPIRVLSSVAGASSVLTVEDCTITDTNTNKVGQNVDILLDYGVGITTASISGTAANVILETASNVGTPVSVVSTETKTFTNAVAKIDNVYYGTLADAVAAAPADGTKTTITLLKDAEGAGIVTDEQNVIIDFGGFTYTINELVGSSGTVTNGFQLLKGSDVELKNGKIAVSEDVSASACILIQNYANLILSGITLDGTNLGKPHSGTGYCYTLSNNCGDVSIGNGVTIIANANNVAFDVCYSSKYYATGTHVVVESGAIINGLVAFDVWTGDSPINPASSLRINGGTFNGDLVVEGELTDAAKSLIVIYGGTFSSNPSAYIASGYEVVQPGNSYLVQKYVDRSSSSSSSKPVEEPEEPEQPEEPVVEPETPAAPGEATVETEVTDGGEVEFEAPVEEPGVDGGSAAADEDEAKITGVVLPTGTDSEVTFVPVSEQPAPAGQEENTKKVFEINVPTYEKGKPATVKFTMTLAELTKDGKTAADVALWHHDEETGEWTKLVTTFVIKDGIVYFEAITFDFSPFAIVYEDTELPTDEPETPEQPTESPAPILAVLAGLGAAVVLRRK